MWAFVLYDSNKNKIIFCRDRFGEKPLYYTKIKKNIYFASEIFQLKNLLKKKLTLDKKYLQKYLFTNYRNLNKTNKTFYKNIYKVQSGSYLEINKNIIIKKKSYFSFNQKTKNFSYKK